MKLVKGSLTFKLMLSISILLLMLSVGLGFVSYNLASDAISSETLKILESEMRDVKNSIESSVEVADNLSQTIASLPSTTKLANIIHIGDSQVEANAFKTLKEFAESIEHIAEGFFIADQNGDIIIDSLDGIRAGVNISDRDYFKTSIKGNSVWSDIIVSKSTGNEVLVRSIPLKTTTGQVKGIVAAVLKLDYLTASANNIETGEGGYAFITDQEGLVLYHEDESKVLKENVLNVPIPDFKAQMEDMIKGNSSYGFYSYKGVEKLNLYDSVWNWHICVNVPKDTYMKPVYDIRFYVILSSILFQILGMIVAIFVSLRIVNKINKVKDVLVEVEKGDLSQVAENKVLKKCWETMNCNITECPAYKTNDLKCWNIDGTMCEHKGVDNCRDCIQYKQTQGDEVSQISRYLDNTVSSIKTMILQISKVAENVSATSEELASSSEESGKSASEIASSIENINSQMEDQSIHIEKTNGMVESIVLDINSIGQNAESIAEFSSEALQTANGAKEVMQNAVVQMDKISDSSVNTNSVLSELKEKSDEIGTITATIYNIADQTNLLALNANIEAARAGEYGRGFAVVAEEIRKLAEMSKSSAEEISSLIELTQKDVDRATESMQIELSEIENGKEVLSSTGQQFVYVISSVDEISEKVRLMADSIDTMRKSINEVGDTMEFITSVSQNSTAYAEEVSASSEEQSAISEEIAAAAEELAKMAENLLETISLFKTS